MKRLETSIEDENEDFLDEATVKPRHYGTKPGQTDGHRLSLSISIGGLVRPSARPSVRWKTMKTKFDMDQETVEDNSEPKSKCKRSNANNKKKRSVLLLSHNVKTT